MRPVKESGVGIVPNRVLFIGEAEDAYVQTRDLLRGTGETDLVLEWTSSLEAAIEAMKRNQHAAYLVDCRPGERGVLDLLRQAQAAGCRTPIILLGEKDDSETEVAAMQAGAEDFLVRGQMDASLLEHSLRHAIQRRQTRNGAEDQAQGQAGCPGTLSSGTQCERFPSYARTEHELVRRALEEAGWNKSEAARLLQISRKRLYRLIQKHGLAEPHQ